jgi:Tfp pilus assembly protein PilE
MSDDPSAAQRGLHTTNGNLCHSKMLSIRSTVLLSEEGKRMNTGKLALIAFIALAGCGAKDQYLCRARQAEAKTNLQALHTAQASYFAEHKKYASTIAELAFAPATSKYYDIVVDTASDKGFTGTATGKGDASGDVWAVDQAGTPAVTIDKCHAK